MIYIIVFLILVFIIAPFSLLFHEIGHLVGATLMRATTVRLMVGLGKPIFETTFGHVQVIIRRFFLMNSVTSTVRTSPFLKREKFMITIMGPLFSGMLTLIAYIAYTVFVPSEILYLFFLFNLWLVIINLIPFKIGHKQSDGYTMCILLIQHLKRRNTTNV